MAPAMEACKALEPSKARQGRGPTPPCRPRNPAQERDLKHEVTSAQPVVGAPRHRFKLCGIPVQDPSLFDHLLDFQPRGKASLPWGAELRGASQPAPELGPAWSILAPGIFPF